MGTSYYDSNGEATFLFGKVPIYAVKKAFFKSKLGTVYQLMKMVYNSVTYDFSKTAEGGAVIFENDYSTWEFIAPDDRLNFESYSSMTLGEALNDMQATLTSNPVPAWEQFVGWFNDIRYTVNSATGYCTVRLRNSRGSISTQINALQFSEMSSFVEFLDTLETACAPALGLDMADFKTSDTSFACELAFINPSSNQEFMSMTFKFRE